MHHLGRDAFLWQPAFAGVVCKALTMAGMAGTRVWQGKRRRGRGLHSRSSLLQQDAVSWQQQTGNEPMKNHLGLNRFLFPAYLWLQSHMYNQLRLLKPLVVVPKICYLWHLVLRPLRVILLAETAARGL